MKRTSVSAAEGAALGEAGCGLRLLGHGAGGITQMRASVREDEVQWALADVHLGQGNLRRRKCIIIHISPDCMPAKERMLIKEYDSEAKRILGAEQLWGFHPEVKVMSKTDVNEEYILDKLKQFLLEDSAKYDIKWMVKQYEQQVATKQVGLDEEQKAKRCPGHASADTTVNGRDSLRAVIDESGKYNWAFVKPMPEPEGFQMIGCGSGSTSEMRECLEKHPKEILFGLVRMGFGCGRLRRTKHIFIHAIYESASVSEKKSDKEMFPRMKEHLKELKVTCSVLMEVTNQEGMTDEIIIDKVRKATPVDDDSIPGDDGRLDVFSVERFRQATREEAAFTRQATQTIVEDLPVEAIVALLHNEGNLNWALFGASDAWKARKVLPPKIPVSTGRGKPGRQFRGGAISFMDAEKRRSEMMSMGVAKPVEEKKEPAMPAIAETVGAKGGYSVGGAKPEQEEQEKAAKDMEFVWQIKFREWTDMDAEDQLRFRAAREAGESVIRWEARGEKYEANIAEATPAQINIRTDKIRLIRELERPIGEKQESPSKEPGPKEGCSIQ